MSALQTFKNLKQSRRDNIIKVSLQEFAIHDYHSASLSNIIQNLGIAKGSFYRYFKSKKDLYFFLMDHCSNLRLNSDQKLLEKEPKDLFEILLHHMRARIRFDKAEPLASAFLNNVLQERNSEELGNIRFLRQQKMLEMTENVVSRFMAKGEIREDLDKGLISWFILDTQLSFKDFIEYKYQQNSQKKQLESKSPIIVSETELYEAAEYFVEILRNGLSLK